MPDEYSSYIGRYSNGEWRGKIFHDLIVADAMKLTGDSRPVLMDIGCGGGFDGDARLQASLAAVASQYIGIEPDAEIQLGDYVTSQHRCTFENAPVPHDSVDIAFSVMVLEHFPAPQLFWDKVHSILREGGIFWGFTVDARHLFVAASLLAEKMDIKNVYLDFLHGKRGKERYENY